MAFTVLQPSDKDCRIRSAAATTNYGTEALISLNNESIDKGHIVVNFDASGVSGTILSATLKLYYKQYGNEDPVGLPVLAYKVVDTRDTWVEDEITWTIWKSGENWDELGGDWEPTTPTPASTNVPAGYGWISWDVTDIVKDAIANVSGSVNILLKFDTETESENYSTVVVYSNDETEYDGDPEEDRRPILEVEVADIDVSDTLSISEDQKGNLSSVESDTLSLSESSKGTDMGFTVTDTISLSDRIIQVWRRLAKHTATWTHLSRGLSQDTKDARIAHWEMNDNLDTDVVLDSEGNYNGTLSDGDDDYTSDHHVEGKVGTGAFDFDGDDDYINCGDITELNSVEKFSISMWVNQDVLGAQDYLFNKDKDSTHRIKIQSSGNYIFFYIVDVGTNYGYLADSNIGPAGSWHHIVMTYNGAGAENADKLKVYIDGVNKTLNFGGTIPATTSNLSGYDATIGRDGLTWDGKIDETSIFNKILSQTDVTALYKLGASTYITETKSTSVWSYLTKNR